MKHLKYITEEFEFDTQLRKVKELGELNLSYLEDEGYIIDYKVTDAIIQYRDIVIEIKLATQPTSQVSYNYKNFSWDNVKDRVIPLVQQLDKDFNVEVEIFDGSSIGWGEKKNQTTDWVINDGPSRWFPPNSIRFIKIKLKSYLFKKGAKL
jgi:hypothetical protein